MLYEIYLLNTDHHNGGNLDGDYPVHHNIWGDLE